MHSPVKRNHVGALPTLGALGGWYTGSTDDLGSSGENSIFSLPTNGWLAEWLCSKLLIWFILVQFQGHPHLKSKKRNCLKNMYVKDIFPTLTILENLKLCSPDKTNAELMVILQENVRLDVDGNIKAGCLSKGEQRQLMNLMTFIA